VAHRLLNPAAMRSSTRPTTLRVQRPVALILDGQPTAALQAEAALRRAGYDVVHTRGIASALQILEHRRIDLLVTGLRLTRRRRRESTSLDGRRPALPLPVIFLATTAAMNDNDGWQGVAGYLYKPLGADQVVRAVDGRPHRRRETLSPSAAA
jgi:DNA-binding NtrC family response regulator